MTHAMTSSVSQICLSSYLPLILDNDSILPKDSLLRGSSSSLLQAYRCMRLSNSAHTITASCTDDRLDCLVCHLNNCSQSSSWLQQQTVAHVANAPSCQRTIPTWLSGCNEEQSLPVVVLLRDGPSPAIDPLHNRSCQCYTRHPSIRVCHRQFNNCSLFFIIPGWPSRFAFCSLVAFQGTPLAGLSRTVAALVRPSWRPQCIDMCVPPACQHLHVSVGNPQSAESLMTEIQMQTPSCCGMSRNT